MAAALLLLLLLGFVVLRLALDPAPVALPAPLNAGMVFCAGDRATGVAEVGFWIDRFEVTTVAFRAFQNATGRVTPTSAVTWSDPATVSDYLPVTAVRLADARAFAAYGGKRLPTSAEWEWAARGPAQFRYPWGDRFIETFANTAELDLWRPTQVGTFFNGRSQFCGAFDLVGNVWEWTETQVAGVADARFVVRGGSFLTNGFEAMDAPVDSGFPERGRTEDPESWSNDLGFRCVADPAAVARDERLRAALSSLGGRDPLRILLEVGPARRTLRDPSARRLVERALELRQDPLVRSRLEAILGAAGGS